MAVTLDWDELAPLTSQQSQSITQLQSVVHKLAPIVPDIDKSKVKILEPQELSSLPKNHKLRERYKLLMQTQQHAHDDDKKNDNDDDDDMDDMDDMDDEYKYNIYKKQKFNYINYFINQMTQERNMKLKLTTRQQKSWNYLTSNANYLKNVLNSIENLQDIMKNLNNIYLQNQNQCQHIHNKCMHLIDEQKDLEKKANILKTQVKYFADYNQIRARLYSNHIIDIKSKEFINIVKRINQCIIFLTNHKEYKESDEYLKNYKVLRSKCIVLIKSYIQKRLKQAEMSEKDVNKTDGKVNVLEFRTAGNTLRPLILLIENESLLSSEYASLLNELQKLLLNIRSSTLKQSVSTTIFSYSSTRDTPNLIRASCSYVMMICLREYKLFREFFNLNISLKKSLLKQTTIITKPIRNRNRSRNRSRSKSNSVSLSGSGSGFNSPTRTRSDVINNDNDNSDIINGRKRINNLINDLCQLLYSYLRPFVIKTSSMQILCDIIHILQTEIQEHIQLRTSIISASNDNDDNSDDDDDDDDDIDSNIPDFDRTIIRIIEDAQERLVFRTQIFLRDKIQNYEIKENDLNYYELLKQIQKNKDKDKDNDNDKDKDTNLLNRYRSWSPILELTLSTLSSIYPVLNHSVFEFLAYSGVSCCVTSLVDLAQKLSHKTSSVHAHLFLIKHLLILREQISPFDVDFSITETTLDFTHMTDYLTSLVSSSQKYSLVEVFKHTMPVVNKHQLNSKKSMAGILTKCCDAFIKTQTNLLCGHLIQLISSYNKQVTIKKIKSLKSINKDDNNDDNDKSKQLLLNELNAALNASRDSLINRINDLMKLMKLYLENELTERLLLKPIISNIQDAFIKLRKIVIETGLQNDVHLNICETISDQLQNIVKKSTR